MSEKLTRKAYKHEISTQDELDFLVQWIKVATELHPNLQGQVNSIAIKFTDKFVGIEPNGTLSICKVEKG